MSGFRYTKIFVKTSDYIYQLVGSGVSKIEDLTKSEKEKLCAFYLAELDGEYFIDLCIDMGLQDKLSDFLLNKFDGLTSEILEDILVFGFTTFVSLFEYHRNQSDAEELEDKISELTISQQNYAREILSNSEH